ncbi:MAG: hypothetical protein ACI8W8_004818 [Rhodothermales bacterium]|jgi:citrate synthase
MVVIAAFQRRSPRRARLGQRVGRPRQIYVGPSETAFTPVAVR